MLDDDNGMNSGSVYIFQFDGKTWVEEAKLVAPDGEPLDWFGMSAAIAGDVAVVTALFDDDAATNAGAAYVFRRISDEWEFETKLTASDAAERDFFGEAVSISNDSILVGAKNHDDQGINSGSAYVFERHDVAWLETAKLTAIGGTFGPSGVVEARVTPCGCPHFDHLARRGHVARRCGAPGVGPDDARAGGKRAGQCRGGTGQRNRS